MQILPPDSVRTWAADLRRRAGLAPPQSAQPPRLGLYAGTALIGSVSAALQEHLAGTQGVVWAPRAWDARPGPQASNPTHQLDPLGPNWCLPSEPSAALACLASALHAAGLVARWHGELLAVRDPSGRCIGAVERGVARLLGIAVHGVHLVGMVDGVGTWVQQRAMHKAEGPGLWDTLVGATVPFSEPPERALARELWEEAGLQPQQLRGLAPRGQFRLARCLDGDGGLSYGVDHIACWTACLAPGVQPVNQDGEVSAFELLAPQALAERLQGQGFTPEAACVLLQVQDAAPR